MGSGLTIIGHEAESCATSPAAFNVHTGKGEGPGAREFRGRAAVVTLGCAKNQVDSEVMLGVLRKGGFEIVADLSEADVAIVNTCGFLESAVKESIDAVLDAAEYKEKGRLRKLIVAGCMVERYRDNLVDSLPEADGFLLLDDILRVGEMASEGFEQVLEAAARPYFLYDDTMPRQLSTRPHTAYMKISEGCNRPCTFCIIPRIRGAMRSRTIDSLVREITDLGNAGVREVNLVAQDSTSYGKDLKTDLTTLLRTLNETKAVEWIRLLYAYPIGIDEELLTALSELDRVCEYLDLPLQHASERVLKAMQRPLGRYSPRSIVDFIRKTSPKLALRTTFIVGFPGETDEDIQELEDFILEGHFTSVGIFTYSPEEGTPGAEMDNQVSDEDKIARKERLMMAQQRVVQERLEGYVGQVLEVMVEGTHEETDLLITGRTRWQAPEVDGCVIINDLGPREGIAAGEICRVEVTEIMGYDLVGRVIE